VLDQQLARPEEGLLEEEKEAEVEEVEVAEDKITTLHIVK
jgi:hypothetical protein